VKSRMLRANIRTFVDNLDYQERQVLLHNKSGRTSVEMLTVS